MKSTAIFGSIAWAGLLSGAAAAPGRLDISDVKVERALPNAPDGYTPSRVDCPASRPSIRSAAKLSSNETSWLDTRRDQTKSALKDFFGHVSIADFDAAGYIDKVSSNSSNLPNVGIAVSGGGYRALLTGAGAIKAFDSRTENSTASGQLGGLLQSATYVAGLSGGSWLVGSIFVNNFSTISDLQTYEDGQVWQFGNSIFEGPDSGSIQIVDSATYYKDIEKEVSGKSDAGFNTSITDYWGRALSYQLVNATNGGPSYTWSSIALTEAFQQAEMPMPLVVADGRYPNQLAVEPGNATVYEFNPWEFGTFDPTIYGFAPLEYLGSRFVDGKLPDNESCVRGFDNAGFVMGTSSTLFNEFLLSVDSTGLPSFLKKIFTSILGKIGSDNDDIAMYAANPFYGWAKSTSPFADQEEINVVDGGEDLENLPLHPLIQPQRHVDVIFAVDASADTSYNWPNGTALVATYERSLNSSGIANGTAFPAIPDQNTIVNQGLNTKPTFFGCDSKNISGTAPLIVYLPNSPYSYLSNVTTFDPSYSDSQRDDIIDNAYNLATMGNSTLDGNWTTCVACAVLSRSFERTNTDVPEACTQCFDKYCWNGTTNTTTPADYEPATVLDSASGAMSVGPSMVSTVVAVGVAFFMMI